jgi:CRP-like cAMP-binding protein
VVDLRKLKAEAAQLSENRSYARAAELYMQIAAAEPQNSDWLHRAGEALKKDGQNGEAAALLRLAAEGYARNGYLLKAIAVCKMVLQIDPGHTAIQKMLAEYYAQRDKVAVRPATPVPATPAVPAVVEEKPRLDPNPAVPLGLELVALDEITVPKGAPLEVVPLASVLYSRKSGQWVLPDAASSEVAPEATAHEISLEELFEVAPRPPPVAPLAPGLELVRLDDQISLSGLFEEAVAPPPPDLPKIPLFSSLMPDRLRNLIERLEVRDVEAGTTLVKEGDRGGSLFVIVTGTARVVTGERELARLSDGEFFGEQAILTDLPRTATVTAETPLQLLELSRQLVSELVADSPEVLRTLLKFFRDRLLNRLLASSALFSSLDPDDARALSERFLFLELEPKMRVVREGERAPGLFLLLAGEVQVLMGQARLATLGPGDVFGEMSLLAGSTAMGSIVTLTKCWALELPAKQFQEIMLSYPQVLAYVSELADRRAESNSRIELL